MTGSGGPVGSPRSMAGGDASASGGRREVAMATPMDAPIPATPPTATLAEAEITVAEMAAVLCGSARGAIRARGGSRCRQDHRVRTGAGPRSDRLVRRHHPVRRADAQVLVRRGLRPGGDHREHGRTRRRGSRSTDPSPGVRAPGFQVPGAVRTSRGRDGLSEALRGGMRC